jgi:hypothetical protein
LEQHHFYFIQGVGSCLALILFLGIKALVLLIKPSEATVFNPVVFREPISARQIGLRGRCVDGDFPGVFLSARKKQTLPPRALRLSQSTGTDGIRLKFQAS